MSSDKTIPFYDPNLAANITKSGQENLKLASRLIAETVGPEIAEVYVFPLEKEFERLTVGDAVTVAGRFRKILGDLPWKDADRLKHDLRQRLNLCGLNKVTDLADASTLDQKIFMGWFNSIDKNFD